MSFEYNEKSVDSSTIKKAVLNAIYQYHPDKQMQYDMEWRILSEDITKYLNVCYESFKGCWFVDTFLMFFLYYIKGKSSIVPILNFK